MCKAWTCGCRVHSGRPCTSDHAWKRKSGVMRCNLHYLIVFAHQLFQGGASCKPKSRGRVPRWRCSCWQQFVQDIAVPVPAACCVDQIRPTNMSSAAPSARPAVDKSSTRCCRGRAPIHSQPSWCSCFAIPCPKSKQQPFVVSQGEQEHGPEPMLCKHWFRRSRLRDHGFQDPTLTVTPEVNCVARALMMAAGSPHNIFAKVVELVFAWFCFVFAFVFSGALRQWRRGNIALITTLPVPDCVNSVPHLHPKRLKDIFLPLQTRKKWHGWSTHTSAHHFPPSEWGLWALFWQTLPCLEARWFLGSGRQNITVLRSEWRCCQRSLRNATLCVVFFSGQDQCVEDVSETLFVSTSQTHLSQQNPKRRRHLWMAHARATRLCRHRSVLERAASRCSWQRIAET